MLGLCLQFIGCIRLVESRFQCYSRINRLIYANVAQDIAVRSGNA